MNKTIAQMIINANNTKEIYALQDYLEENQVELDLLKFLIEYKHVVHYFGIAQKFLYEPKEKYYDSLALKNFLPKCKNITQEEFIYFATSRWPAPPFKLDEYKIAAVRYQLSKKEDWLQNFCLRSYYGWSKKDGMAHFQKCLLIAKYFQLRKVMKEIKKANDALRWSDKRPENGADSWKA